MKTFSGMSLLVNAGAAQAGCVYGSCSTDKDCAVAEGYTCAAYGCCTPPDKEHTPSKPAAKKN